jgi:hypothetical protein
MKRYNIIRAAHRSQAIILRRALLHSPPTNIIFLMARGWESKSVEEQQAQAASAPTKPHTRLTPAQLATERKKQGLVLSRQRLLQQLKVSQNPNHRKMLESALADLDAQLAQLG